MATSRSVELVGRVLGARYRLMRPLGAGASATVYVADDLTLRRRVAVKVLHPGLADDAAFLRRFEAEARVVASLHHPAILEVYDFGHDGGSPWLVTELLEGGSLRATLDDGHLLSLAQAARVGADVARGLDHAHRRGLVHRDIKPANLLFDEEGRVRIADFGLARALAEASWTEPAGALVGTARYAAPEQLGGGRAGSRADVYALALVLVEAVTGQVPFGADTIVATLAARSQRGLEPGEALGPLAAALAAAGAVDATDRPDAAELAAALEGAAAELPRPDPVPLATPAAAAGGRRDDDLTVLAPGRPGPFDIEVLEAAPAATEPAPVAAAGVAPPPTAALATGGVGAVAPGGPARRRRRWPWVVLAAVVLSAGGAAAIVATRPAPLRPVPDLVGRPLPAARRSAVADHLSLRVGGSAYSASVPRGSVLAQSPAGGRTREGSAVAVTVSEGPQPVPVPTGLAGKGQADATTILQTLGLAVGAVTTQPSMQVAQGLVISSSPATGTLLPGQPVSLVVSSGPPVIAVPTLTGSQVTSFGAAKAALYQAGFLATEDDEYSDTVPKGEVITTVPSPGALVREGSTITVRTSKGPDVVAVPAVAGQSVGAAASSLSAAGLSVSGVQGNPIATVTGTAPAAGAVVHRGAAVVIVTS